MSARTHVTIGLQAAALALCYPDAELVDGLPLVRRAAAALRGPAGAHLRAFCDHATATPLTELQADYVETFDLRRRCCLYLTYYTHGDTRKRGTALLEFTGAYRAAGEEVVDGELPDHLGVVCEFAARHPDRGLQLLRRHRAGVELLRLALADASSPYLDVVDAIREVLPDPTPRDLDRALVLARSGPPAEEVGLEPFAPPGTMSSGYGGGRR